MKEYIKKIFEQIEKLKKYKIDYYHLKNEPLKLVLIIFIFLIFVSFVKTIYEKHKVQQEVAILVKVAKIGSDDVDRYIDAIGTINPEFSAIITPLITGTMLSVNFVEGQKVEKDQILAEIDPAIYKASLVEAEGQLARDVALLENAKLDLKRYEELWKQNSTSKQTLDTQIQLVKQYKGTVIYDEGNLENALLNLSYCKIKSPIDGTVGIRLIDPGNIVTTTSQIAIVNKMNPASAVFSIPERDLQSVVLKFKNESLDVLAYDENQKNIISTGKLASIDNQIDTSTGSIKLKASFDNQTGVLFPNQFINIKLKIETIKEAFLAPISAVQYGKNGPYVFKIEENQKVNLVNVEVGIVKNDKIVIKSGLVKDDLVVTEGIDKLISGSIVKFEVPS